MPQRNRRRKLGSEPEQRYLSDESPNDEIWDNLKNSSTKFAQIYEQSGFETQQRRGQRCDSCSEILLFGPHVEKDTGELKHKLKSAQFCKVRLCPVCMQRKSLRWKARFHKAWPEIKEESPKARYLHLVLTVRNCPITELRTTIKDMNAAWNRLNSRNTFPATGYVKSLEVTREMNFCATCAGDKKKRDECKDRDKHTYNENAHPHMHVLLQVPAKYFDGKNYFNHEKWAEIWKQSLKADYTPVVWVETVKPKKKKKGDPEPEEREEGDLSIEENAVARAVKEVVKYTVKPSEILEYVDHAGGVEWFLELDSQLEKTRAVSLGGSFKSAMSEEDPTEEEMIAPADEDEEVGAVVEYREYFFHKPKLRYALKRILTPSEYEPPNQKGDQEDTS